MRSDAQGGEQVVIELKDGLSPGVVKSFEDEGALLCYHAHENLTPLMGAKIGWKLTG